MNIRKVKLIAVGLLSLPLIAGSLVYTDHSVAVTAEDDVEKTYRASCLMCHGADASKKYNPDMPEEEQVDAILKGKKAEKPPHMPAYESKGIDEAKAKALVAYMKGLRNPNAEDGNVGEETGDAGDGDSADSVEISEDTIATYKTKCAMCHKAAAEKLYDPQMSLDEQIEAILSGKKAEKPPHMPAYKTKGISEDQAKELALYMRQLRSTE